ncbi:MAG: hypothetical protein LBG20_00150 [Holosporaceae bacterium]|jgi:activator of 2-hydroxyglutaryl-CoA dehydratase|nr:hypothetical protein [Holosporaceae bacterium]
MSKLVLGIDVGKKELSLVLLKEKHLLVLFDSLGANYKNTELQEKKTKPMKN